MGQVAGDRTADHPGPHHGHVELHDHRRGPPLSPVRRPRWRARPPLRTGPVARPPRRRPSAARTGRPVPPPCTSGAFPVGSSPSRARAATPRAVAWGEANTSMGTWSRSAWCCMRNEERDSPPSTRSSSRGPPRSSAAAAASSATWAARPSSVARTTWAGEVWRSSPSSVPVADGHQYGAPSPASAGTMVTPDVSGDAGRPPRRGPRRRAAAPSRRATRRPPPPCSSGRRGSRTAEPGTSQATEADSPWVDRRGIGAGRDQEEGARPVRALGLPGRQASLADQGGLLVDGQAGHRECGPEGRRGPDRRGAPHDLGQVGRRPARRSPQPRRTSSRVSRSSTIERDAVVTSVTNPPVSAWSNQVSVVVTTPSVVRFRRSHASFGAEKYGSSGRPEIAASRSRCAVEARRSPTWPGGPATTGPSSAAVRWRGPRPGRSRPDWRSRSRGPRRRPGRWRRGRRP